MADRTAPDLGDLVGVRWESWWPQRRRLRALLTALVGLVVLGLGASTVALAVQEGVEGLVQALLPVVGPLGVTLTSRRGVQLDVRGLRRRHGLLHGRWRPWSDVVDVRPAGRWDDWPVAVLDRERLDLRGLASEDAVRLAAALARARGGVDEARDATAPRE